jgi:predicted O-methyltransferase YrrM
MVLENPLPYDLDYNGEPQTALDEFHLRWLLRYCAHRPVHRSIEVGLGLGISACALFHSGVSEHVAIEIATDRQDIARGNVAKVKKARQTFTLFHGPADKHLPRLVDGGEAFDLMLIDGGHRFDDAFIDAHYAKSLLRPGGIMLIDDVQMAGVGALVDWLDQNMQPIWRKVTLPGDVLARGMACYERTDIPTWADGRQYWHHRSFKA